jgi:hypothetical protein
MLDADYRNGNLFFTLNHVVNRDWIQIFQNPSENYTYQESRFMPAMFRFEGKFAIISATVEPNQDHVQWFKHYLEMANRGYATLRATEQKEKEDKERARLRYEIEEEEKRRRFRQSLKI